MLNFCILGILSIESLFFTEEIIKKANRNPADLEKMNIQKLKKIHPIIYLNALMGHSLEAKLENIKVPNWFCHKNSPFYTIWLDKKYFALNVTTQCAVNVLKPHYDSKRNKIINNPGVTIRPKDFGGMNGLRFIDVDKTEPYLNTTIQYLEKLGYVVGKTLRSGAFDWRKGPNEYIVDDDLKNIKKLIEDTYKENGNTKVHLLGHSYGGPIGNFFLSDFVDQEWKDRFIKSFIPYGSAYDGSVSTMLQLVRTSNRGPSYVNKAFVELAKSLSSTSWLLPTSDYWSEKILVETSKGKYYGKDLFQYFKDYNMEMMMQNHKNNLRFSKTKAPNVPVNCFYGINIPTITGYKLNEDNSVQALHREDGDGTVPLRGLKVCDSFSRRQNPIKYPVKIFAIDKLHHADVSSELFLNSLTSILNE